MKELKEKNEKLEAGIKDLENTIRALKNENEEQILSIKGIELLLNLNVIPILYGDVILDENHSFSIISGDRIILEICKKLNVRNICVLTGDPESDEPSWQIKLSSSKNIEFEDIKLRCHKTDHYHRKYLLLIPCVKCGLETTYTENIRYRPDLGEILTNFETSPESYRICGDCKNKESELHKTIRNNDYETRQKERAENTIKQLADIFAKILRDGGYRDLYNEEMEE